MILYHGSDIAHMESIERFGLQESGAGLGVWMSPTRDVALYTIAARRGHRVNDMAKEFMRDFRERALSISELKSRHAELSAAGREKVRGVLVTLELPDDYGFRYRNEERFGYCAPVARVPRDALLAVEGVTIDWPTRRALNEAYGGIRSSGLTKDEAARFAKERQAWLNWPRNQAR